MIAVDSTVWIDHFNGRDTAEVRRLHDLIGDFEIFVGDLVLCEVLQGFRDERDADRAREALEAFRLVEMVGIEHARATAANYRLLRRKGVTVRKTIDMLIATWCIEMGFALLHADRDYDVIAIHLPLRLA